MNGHARASPTEALVEPVLEAPDGALGRRTWRRALWLLGVPLALFGPALLPGRLLLPQHPAAFEPLALEDPARAANARALANDWASDALFPFTTDRAATRRAFAAGTAPTWEPLLGLGTPLFAGSLSSVADPLALPHLAAPVGVGFAWSALLASLVGGLGMLVFLRGQGLAPAAQVLGAVLFQAGGYGVVHAHLPMQVHAALWLPWCLAAVDRLGAGSRWAGLALSAATAASFLAGFPPIAVFVAAATLLYAASRVPGYGARALVRAASGLALGVAGAAVLLLPMAEASRLSTRDTASAGTLEAQSLPRAALATLLVPGLFGTPQDPFHAPRNPLAWWLTDADETDKALVANGLEWNAHAGLVALLLALAALVGAPGRTWRPGVLLALVLGFAFGLPPLSWLVRVPGLDLGAPGRALAVAWTLWAWLAAHGLEALARRRAAAAGLLAVLALLATALGLGLASAGPPDALAANLETRLTERHAVTREEVRRYVPPEIARAAGARLIAEGRALALFPLGVLGCAAVSLVLGARGLSGRRALIGLVPWLLLAGTEGVRLARVHAAPRSVPGPLFPPSPAMDAIRAAAGTGRVVRLDESDSGVDDVIRLARPNLLSAYGIGDLTPYVVFPATRVVELLERVDPASRFRSGVSRVSDPRVLAHPSLDVLRVTCVLARRPIEHPRLTETFALEGFHVHHRSGARPDAEVFPTAVSARGPAALEALARGALDPARVLVLDAPEKELSLTPPGDWRSGSVEVRRPAPDRVEVDVTGGSGGWLVLYDLAWPGWRATVDGQPRRVWTAQHVARAVRVPAGDVRVRFRYAPGSLRAGALVSALALLLALWGAWRSRPARA